MESLVASVPAVRAALGGAAVTVATALATRTGLVAVDLPVLLVLVAATALVVPLGYGLLVGVTAWAMLTGFAVNSAGVLTFHRGDLAHLAVLVGVAVAAWSLAHTGAPRLVSGSVPRRAGIRAGSPVRSR